MKYVKVDWPNNQEVGAFKSEYLDDCYYCCECDVWFVPEDTWLQYLFSPGTVVDNSDIITNTF